MKKILGLSIAALLITGLVVGGTLAFFSDTETSADNVFIAGTIDLEVDDQNPWVSTIDGDWGDYKPDQTVAAAQITLKNVGTNPMDVWMKITKTATSQGTDTEPELAEEDGTPKHDIDTVIRYELTVGGTPVIEYDDDYTITTNATLETTGIDTYYIWIGNIAAAGTLTVDQNFKMDADTTNWAQGDTMTFTIEFFAQQSEGDTTPTAPATELTGYERPVPEP